MKLQEVKGVITLLADTSALISLEIKGLVSRASKLVRFIISSAVYDELSGIAKFEEYMADPQNIF